MSSARWLSLGWVVLTLRLPGVALAAPPVAPSSTPSPPSNTPNSAAARPSAPIAALAGIAERLAAQLATSGAPAAGALLVVGPPRSDVALVRGDELALRLGQVVSGKVGARTHERPTSLAAARTLAERAGRKGRSVELVFLQLELERGQLRVVADLYPSVTNGWERAKNPQPGPRAHGFASAPVDAEVRAFLPPILLEQAKTARAPHREGEVLAVACGDVDGDGGLELALLSRSRVALGRFGAGGFAIERTAPLRELTARLPVPFREPIGAVFVTPGGGLLVGTTERGGVALGGDLAALPAGLAGSLAAAALVGLPASADGLCATFAADRASFDGLAPCLAGAGEASRGPAVPTPARFDAFSALRYVDAAGRSHQALALREPGGRLTVRVDGAEVLTQEGAGAQVLLADLDLDGVPELVTTADTGDDRVVVASLGAASPARARLRLEAKGGVRALGVCPPEVDGKPALVAVVGPEVWLVR